MIGRVEMDKTLLKSAQVTMWEDPVDMSCQFCGSKDVYFYGIKNIHGRDYSVRSIYMKNTKPVCFRHFRMTNMVDSWTHKIMSFLIRRLHL